MAASAPMEADAASSGAGTDAVSSAAAAPAPAAAGASASASAAPAAAAPARTLARTGKTTGISSTTSTLFLSSTMAVPDADEVILGKAAVLYCQLAADAAAGRRCPITRADDMLLFCEDLYVPERAAKRETYIRTAAEASAASKALLAAQSAASAEAASEDDAAALAAAKARASSADDAWNAVTSGTVPNIEQLYSFSAKVHEMGQFSPETVVLSLILINRLASSSGMPVGPATWRLVGLIGTLLAQKLWDDASVANSDFPTLLKAVLPGADISVREINRLERRFLGLIKYKVTFTGSLYARYYFELRTIAEENHKKFRLAPLSKEQAERLEARSRSKAETLRGGSAFAGRRSKTSDDGLAPRSRAVLS